MSVLILAQRFGSEPRHLMIRGFEGIIGYDRFGRLSEKEVERPFFTISRRTKTYGLTINDPAFSRCTDAATAELTQNSKISGEDFEFNFYIVDPYAELLAFADINPRTRAGRFGARMRIGPGCLLSPLPLSGHITVGSAADAGIHVPLSVVAASALEIFCEPSALMIKNGSETTMISEATSVALGQSGLELEIVKN